MECAGATILLLSEHAAAPASGYLVLLGGLALSLLGCSNWLLLKGRHSCFMLLALLGPVGFLPILFLEYRIDHASVDRLVADAAEGRLRGPLEEGPDQTREEKLAHILRQLRQYRKELGEDTR